MSGIKLNVVKASALLLAGLISFHACADIIISGTRVMTPTY